MKIRLAAKVEAIWIPVKIKMYSKQRKGLFVLRRNVSHTPN